MLSAPDPFLASLAPLPDVTVISSTVRYTRGQIARVEPVEGCVGLCLPSRQVALRRDGALDHHEGCGFVVWVDTPVHAVGLPNGDLVLSTGGSVVVVHPPGRFLRREGFFSERSLCDALGSGRINTVLAVVFSTQEDGAGRLRWSEADESWLSGIQEVLIGSLCEASLDVRKARLTLMDVVALEKGGPRGLSLPTEIGLDVEDPVFELPCGSAVTFGSDKLVFFLVD